jgi:cytochrome c oxidase subunit IV
MGAEASPAAGVGILAILGYTIYWVVRSRKRWRTILYVLLAAAGTLLIGIFLASMFPQYAGAFGTLFALFLFIAMAATAAEHARSTIRSGSAGEVERP